MDKLISSSNKKFNEQIIPYLFIFLFFFISQNFVYSQSYYDYELKSITFKGNNNFSAAVLKQNIESKESPMWFWVFLDSFTPFGSEKIYFDSAKVSADQLALKEFYTANGFFFAKVTHQISVDAENKTIGLEFDINEGNLFMFGKLELKGFERLEEYDYNRMVDEAITIDSSKRFSEAEVQSNISDIKKYLANNGFVFNSYDSTVIMIDTLTFRADVSLYFFTGSKYRVSELIVNKTGGSIQNITNELITEIAGIKQGSIFDQSVIDRSEMRLLKTELFDNLNINPMIGDTVGHTIPLEVNASITALNELGPEIKTDNEYNAFNLGLGANYIRKNFLGDARKLTVSTSFRLIDIIHFDFSNIFKSGAQSDSTYQAVYNVSLKLEQPYLFGRPILTSTEIYYSTKTRNLITERVYGGSQKFDFEMPNYTYITLLRPFLNVDVINKIGKSIDLSWDLQSVAPGIGVEVGASKTNDLQFPTKGYYLFFTPEVYRSHSDILLTGTLLGLPVNNSLSESAYFYRFQAGISAYASTNRLETSIMATKFRFGYIHTFSGTDQLIPPTKTFYAGGSNSVRGWGARKLIPNEPIGSLFVTTEEIENGGTIWMEGSIEFRRKMNEYVGFAIFGDYGNTWNSFNAVTLPSVAVSIGFGLRIYTPIAPFRLDFGTKFYDPEDQRMIFKKNLWENLTFHFGIGEAF